MILCRRLTSKRIRFEIRRQKEHQFTPVFLALSGAVIMALTFGLRQSFGLYLPPISMELEARREAFPLSMGLMNLVFGGWAHPPRGPLPAGRGLERPLS